ncbi:hypothetical protein [Paenibacillus bovis]|uniref:Uncharacterized protein n=1 Tax=Paenibacillus bovis TaxID=1616788 RepID=A0A172ZJ03_9BACL|nr:hypothetical protein [Paenibacillus bovis]ANF97110.1 hypothetical protein AR543_14605 [Paenibacillus bovis]
MKLRKTLPFAVTLSLFLSSPCNLSYASENSLNDSEYNIVEAKQQLADQADSEWANRATSLQTNENINVDSLLTKLSSEGLPANEIEEQLKPYGIYHLDVPQTSENLNSITADQSDIAVSRPDIYYDSSKKQWVIVGAGYWKTDNWLSHKPFVTSGGEIINIGGPDAFGVSFTNKGTTYTTSLKKTYATLSNGSGTTKESQVRSDGNGRFGFGFRLQDYILRKQGYTDTFTYVGKHFAGLARYDENFEKYSGTATTYYFHTFNKTSLDTITFGVSNTEVGISATYINKGSQIEAYSGDTNF